MYINDSILIEQAKIIFLIMNDHNFSIPTRILSHIVDEGAGRLFFIIDKKKIENAQLLRSIYTGWCLKIEGVLTPFPLPHVIDLWKARNKAPKICRSS